MRSLNTYHREFIPSLELQDSIKCFWYDKIDFEEIKQGVEVVPDGYAEIIFHFGSDCSISRNGIIQPLPSPFIIGLLNKPVHFYSQDHLQIIAVRCYPWAVFDLLGLPSGKNGVQVFNHPVAQLQLVLNDLVKSGKIEEAVAEVQQYFLNAHSEIAANSILFKAGAAMSKTNGTLPVSQVADAAHVTVRTLERNFKQSSGYSVKDVSGLMRFEQVRNRLWLFPTTNLAGLAHESGYSDQSHLSREFKRYSGTTPAAFARKAKESKQMSDDFITFTHTDAKIKPES